MPIATYDSPMPTDRDALRAWHLRRDAFERLVPPWDATRVVAREGEIHAGGSVTLRVPPGFTWVAEHIRCDDDGFEDEQVSGPFKQWHHTHTFAKAGDGTSRLIDAIGYKLPMGPLGSVVAGRSVRRRLDRTFAFRHARTANDLARAPPQDAPTKRIAITGASGQVGSALAATLRTQGHEVVPMVRRRAHAGEIEWRPGRPIDPGALDGIDTIFHLAGANIGDQRWSKKRKTLLYDSRAVGTRTIADAVAACDAPPHLVSMSAVGIYGDSGDAPVDESAPVGDLFLSEICHAWERAADPARDAGVTVTHPRMGVVLHARKGALARMLMPTRLGAGGPLAGGRQYLPWIAEDDAVHALIHLADRAHDGPVNVCAPQQVTQREFQRTLSRVLRRPAIAPLPTAAVSMMFGQMGRELLVAGQRVDVDRLSQTGYAFFQPGLEGALRFILGR